MKHNNNQQEILLIATSGFSNRELCDKTSCENTSRQVSITDRLAEACWSGLLHEMIPDLIQRAESGKSLYIWEIRHAAASLQIRLSDVPPMIESEFSIDPQYFLAELSRN